MSSNNPKSLSELIGSSESTIGQLAAKAQAKVGLTDHIRKGLPAGFAAKVVHCSVEEDGTLLVRTSGPEWANRLRFENETLLSLARQKHPETTQVKVRVAHPDP